MAYPLHLTGLTTREAITDTVIRALHGLDFNDETLFESVWAKEEPSFDLNGPVVGLDNLKEKMLNVVGPLTTQHLLANARIDVKEGEKTAKMTAYALNQHYRPGEGVKGDAARFLAGGNYAIDLVEESGEWKIQTWKMTVIWFEGDRSVMAG